MRLLRLGAVARALSRNPGYLIAFVLTLGLGIGVNTAIFSVVYGVLLKPLPYPHADRIVYLTQPVARLGIENINFSFVEVADYRDGARTIDEVVEFGDWVFNVLGRGEPHRATGGLVTPNFFTVLGLQPILGRTLAAEDEGRTTQPVAVLTYEYWMRVFGGNLNVIGEVLDLTVKKAIVVGVLEPGSHYASSNRRQDFYVNYAANDHYLGAAMQDERTHRMTDVFARLAPAATLDAAQAELRALNANLQKQYTDSYPAEDGYSISVTPWREVLTARARPTLLLLLATAGFVLLIACANVANLTLTRVVGRENELAVRAALGAGPGRLRLVLLRENLLLSLAGAGLGLVLAVATTDLLVDYASRFTFRTGEIGIDRAAFLFAVLVASGSALLFAWVPSLRFTANLGESLSSGGASGRTTGSTASRRLQRLLVVGQVAISFVLLVGAGLLVRSLINLHRVDPGFDLENVLTMDAPDFSQHSQEKRLQFTDQLIEEVTARPGIDAAAVASTAPLQRTFSISRRYQIDGLQVHENATAPPSRMERITAGYFNTIGTPLSRGRDFASTDHQDSAPVAIISRSMADFYFGDQDPIGRGISWEQGGNQWTPPRTIVGVAADNKAGGIAETPVHTLYLPAAQSFIPSTVLVRAQGGKDRHLQQVVKTIRTLDPNRPVDNIRTLEEARLENIAPQRLNATLFGIFALLALVIAVVGIAGLLAFTVSRRFHEIGVRMALGASRRSVVWMVLREGTWMVMVGLAVGAVGVAVLSGSLSDLLFGVDPIDLSTLAGVALLLTLVAVGGCWIPAQRASSVDPMRTLRSQ